MKLRSSSQASFKRHPSTDSLPQPKMHLQSSRTKKQLAKQQMLTGHKLSYSKRQTPIDKNTKVRVIYDFNKQVQDHYVLKKQFSRRSEKKIIKRPSTSRKSSSNLLPKLNTDRRRVDDGILIISDMPQQSLLKMPSFSRIEIGINVNTDEKKKKYRLKENLFQQLQNQLKKSFQVRIINGIVQMKSPDILNLKRTKEKQMDKIDSTMSLIDRFTKKYNIKGNYTIQYYPFINLIEQNNPSNKDIISSFSLSELSEQLQKIPGSDFTQQNGTDKAVIKIQSAFKMWQERKQYLKYRLYLNQIKFIQQYWRRKLLKISFKKQIKLRKTQKIQRFNQIQKQFREKWYMTKNKQKWEIHLPNIGVDQFKKLTTQNLIQQQTSQILRIFKIAHQFLINIIFISPIPFHQQVLQYYYKILQINNMMEWASRIRVIYPENYLKFSRSISISRLILQSPIALSKLKNIINGQAAYIVPGQNTISDLQLALELNVPIFGSIFQTNYLNTHSGRYTLLKKCQIPTPVVAKDIYLEQQLINTLAVLMFNNINTKRWILRIDDQIGGRQQAYINPNVFPMVKTLLKSFGEIQDCQQAYDLENQIVTALAQQLRNHLYKKLKIAQKSIYHSSKEFLNTFFLKGGVIEKCIEGQAISVSFIIYPDGQIDIIHARTLIKSGSRVIGSISPIKLTIYNEIQYMVKGVARQIYNDGIIGHFTLQVLVSYSQQKYYCQGLKCNIDSLTSQAYLSGLINNISIPKQTNQPQNYMIYCPMLIHQGIGQGSIKGFFQKSRLLNIQFDVKTKQGVIFLLHDTLQSKSLGIIAVSQTYRDMLQRLMSGLEFITSQYQGKSVQCKLSVIAMKSKVKLLLNQIKQKPKQLEQNLQWLF